MAISIVVPTFNNTEFLEECINSIYNSGIDVEYELLIGIDACEKTLDFINQLDINKNTKVFLFSQNRGPYVIKNTLAKLSKYENIIFFDSDDVMEPIMVSLCENGLQKYSVVKCLYKNFRLINDEKQVKHEKKWGEGVFAIKKDIFLGLNGFEDWRVAADSDFMARLYRNRAKIWHPNETQFLRRLHPNSLTMSEDTGFSSQIRNHYANISRSKTYFGPLQQITTGEYMELIFEKNEILNLKDLFKETPNSDLEKKLKENKKLISKILKNEDIKPILRNSNKLDYQQINSKIRETGNQKIQMKTNEKIKHFGTQFGKKTARKIIR
jgi:glycosyltransferase involved in cell wall biosynthesis